MLVLQNTPRAGSRTSALMDLPGLVVRREPLARATAKFDLSFSLMECRAGDGSPEGIDGVVEFSTDLFDRQSVESMVIRLLAILEAVVANPDQPIGQIEILSPGERHQLLVEYNDTARDVAAATLPELFEAQVQRTPDNTALVFGDAALTYGDLNARANQLAGMLIARGVGPEDFVALAVPRSLEMVVALLGVLKAGGAYLPIDPDYPAARIAFMLDDARPACVITTTATSLPDTSAHPVIVLDDPDTAEALAHYPDTDPHDGDRTRPLTPQNPAYLIYTSGSTGTPKAVLVEHRSVAHYVRWAAERYPSVRGSALVHSTLSFDLTVTGLYAPLIAGGCVQLCDPALSGAVGAGPDGTFMKTTPSALALLSPLPDGLPSIRELVLGGEPLPRGTLDLWRRSHPAASVISAYGPTEATVNCTDHCIAPRDCLPDGVVPIGRPIANTQVYVLDAALRPVPPRSGG